MNAEPTSDLPRFRLMRYFTLTTLVVFVLAGVALLLLQRQEEEFFDRVQREQAAYFVQAQAELARQHEQAARDSLLALHEASHVNLTRVVGNLMWARDIAPLVALAQAIPVEPCRAQADAPARKACFASVGARIQALPGFAELDAKARVAMRATSVVKMKVWDLRGIAVYSSDARQVGEDGSANLGWRSAVGGRPESELTHRDRFSAFEQEVENRDVISSYVPARGDVEGPVVGVFELYSDVTTFLAQMNEAARRFASLTSTQEAEVKAAARTNQGQVYANSDRFVLIVGGLMVLLYLASLAIVRVGQRFIDRQFEAQQQATQREQLWHREKMAALSTLAANVSHEVGNPLAVISGIAAEWPASGGTGADSPPARIRAQASRISAMMRQISDFADARDESAQWVDVNAMVKTVCDFQTFDRRYRGVAIGFEPGDGLPACELVPGHLNEVMMSLLQVGAAHATGRSGTPRMRVRTEAREGGVAIEFSCCTGEPGASARGLWPAAASGLRSVPQRLQAMGARLDVDDQALRVLLPLQVPTRGDGTSGPSGSG